MYLKCTCFLFWPEIRTFNVDAEVGTGYSFKNLSDQAPTIHPMGRSIREKMSTMDTQYSFFLWNVKIDSCSSLSIRKSLEPVPEQ